MQCSSDSEMEQPRSLADSVCASKDNITVSEHAQQSDRNQKQHKG